MWRKDYLYGAIRCHFFVIFYTAHMAPPPPHPTSFIKYSSLPPNTPPPPPLRLNGVVTNAIAWFILVNIFFSNSINEILLLSACSTKFFPTCVPLLPQTFFHIFQTPSPIPYWPWSTTRCLTGTCL